MIDKIFCDLDGVLADFVGYASRLFYDGQDWEKLRVGHRLNGNKFSEQYEKHISEYPFFWATIPPTNEFYTLWGYLQRHEPKLHVLTAYPDWDRENALEGKKYWNKKHLGLPHDRFIMCKRQDKPNWACPRSVLIDDYDKNILAWRKAGGIGIHHVDIANTLAELKKYGID